MMHGQTQIKWQEMFIGLHIKYHLFLSDLIKLVFFSIDFRKNIQKPSFMTIRPVGADLFHADRRTDNDEANSRF